MPSFLAALALVSLLPKALAQSTPTTPLASKKFEYTALPYQADTDDGERGHQTGYNICNSTTEGKDSLCQTAIINSIEDFCLWGPSEPNSEIGVIEGEAVAWCTKPGYGTRLIPKGALTGVQFIKTPDYVQVTGIINQDQSTLSPMTLEVKWTPMVLTSVATLSVVFSSPMHSTANSLRRSSGTTSWVEVPFA